MHSVYIYPFSLSLSLPLCYFLCPSLPPSPFFPHNLGALEFRMADEKWQFDEFKLQRMSDGKLLPQGNGVLIFNEVKVVCHLMWNSVSKNHWTRHVTWWSCITTGHIPAYWRWCQGIPNILHYAISLVGPHKWIWRGRTILYVQQNLWKQDYPVLFVGNPPKLSRSWIQDKSVGVQCCQC